MMKLKNIERRTVLKKEVIIWSIFFTINFIVGGCIGIIRMNVFYITLIATMLVCGLLYILILEKKRG